MPDPADLLSALQLLAGAPAHAVLTGGLAVIAEAGSGGAGGEGGGGHGASGYVLDLLVLLAAAAAVALIAPRIRVPSIPGYLLIGALVGPSAVGLIQSDDNVRQIGELAIILLMFTIGLHFDLDAIRSGAIRMVGVGIISTIASAGACWLIGLALGLSSPAALATGLALSISSTAVVMGILNQRRELHSTFGRLCVGIELVQDLLSVVFLLLLPLLAVLPSAPALADALPSAAPAVAHAAEAAAGHGASPLDALVEQSGLPRWARMIVSAALALGAIAAIILVGRFALPRLLGESGRGGNSEAMLVLSAAAALLAAGLTTYVGLGPVLGSFLAGFMLAGTPFRHQLAGQLSPMRDLFMAVFFTAVGIKINIGVVASAWWLMPILLVLLLLVKAGVIALTVWAGGGTARISVRTGFTLWQAGEFSLVIIAAAVGQGILGPSLEAKLIALVVLSLVFTSPVYELGLRLAERLPRIPLARWITTPAFREHHEIYPAPQGLTVAVPVASLADGPDTHALIAGSEIPADPVVHAEPASIVGGQAALAAEHPATPAAPARHVVIAGFGVVGRNLAEHFAVAGIPFTVVELNPATVMKQQKLGRATVYGDISNPDVLESAGIHAAQAVVLTIPDDDATLRACRTIRAMAPDIYIAARTSYLSRAIAATELGADHVTIEELVAAQDMAKRVMEELRKRMSRGATA